LSPPRASTATGVDACFAPGFVEFDAFSSWRIARPRSSRFARPGYPRSPTRRTSRLTAIWPKTFDFDPQKDARRELLVAAAQARKAATAALHNKRVNEQRSSAIRMKTTIEHYTRSTINRRLKVRSRIES
jgi:hypothetical protein